LSGIKGGEVLGPVKACCLSVEEFQCNEVGVGGWEWEHLHRSRGWMGQGVKGITFEREVHKIANKIS